MPITRQVEVDGHTYPSAYEAWLAEARPDVKYGTFTYRMRHGWEPWRALRVKPMPMPFGSKVPEILPT